MNFCGFPVTDLQYFKVKTAEESVELKIIVYVLHSNYTGAQVFQLCCMTGDKNFYSVYLQQKWISVSSGDCTEKIDEGSKHNEQNKYRTLRKLTVCQSC